jgi:hypothetical protein
LFPLLAVIPRSLQAIRGMTCVELYLSSNALTALDLRLFQNDFVNELVDTYNPTDPTGNLGGRGTKVLISSHLGNTEGPPSPSLGFLPPPSASLPAPSYPKPRFTEDPVLSQLCNDACGAGLAPREATNALT